MFDITFVIKCDILIRPQLFKTRMSQDSSEAGEQLITPSGPKQTDFKNDPTLLFFGFFFSFLLRVSHFYELILK